MAKYASILILLAWISAPAAATEEEPSMFLEGGHQALIYDIKTVSIEISDQVGNGCLPRPNDAVRSAEAALRRNNFQVVPPEDRASWLGPTVQLSVFGYSLPGGHSCIVVFSLHLVRYAAVTVPYSMNLSEPFRSTLAPIDSQIYQTVLTGPKDSMQDRIEREAEKASNDLLIDVDRARDAVKKNWPQLWSAFQKEGH